MKPTFTAAAISAETLESEVDGWARILAANSVGPTSGSGRAYVANGVRHRGYVSREGQCFGRRLASPV
jgi:hypothetical protein